MSKFIPLSVPNIKGNEASYVMNALQAEWVSTGGSYINEFEARISQYLNVDGAVAVQSGTAGIHLALRAIDVNEEDEIIVPTLTFIAAVNPVSYCGASPIFMDCDDSLCMDMNKLAKFCRNECFFNGKNLINKLTQRKIKGVIIVHVFGNIADMESLMDIAQEYNLKVIEDATEALGSKYISGRFADKFAGTIGDIGIFSFNGNKIITTGGGGMVVAQTKSELEFMRYLSTQAKDDEVAYIHHHIGYNYRMTNVQAAIGLGQLESLEAFIEVKRSNYHMYKELLEVEGGFLLLPFSHKIRPNYWFYSIILSSYSLKRTKEEIIHLCKSNGIQVRPIWGLIYQQKPYKAFQNYEISLSIYYYDNIINIPCSTNLSVEDVAYVSNVLLGAR